MPGRIETEVIATLVRRHPMSLTVTDIACEVYGIDRWRDTATNKPQRRRDLAAKYIVVRRALVRLKQQGEAERTNKVAKFGARPWGLSNQLREQRRKRRAQSMSSSISGSRRAELGTA